MTVWNVMLVLPTDRAMVLVSYIHVLAAAFLMGLAAAAPMGPVKRCEQCWSRRHNFAPRSHQAKRLSRDLYPAGGFHEAVRC